MDYECRHDDRPSDDAGALDGVKPLIFGLLAIPALAWAQGKQTFTGVVTDSMCADGDHSHMKMGPTDAECTIACVSIHDAMFVLYDDKEAYTLSDQRRRKSSRKKVR